MLTMQLSTNVDIYVGMTGDDTTGDGSANKPFRTIKKAVNSIPKNLGGHTATINIADGQYWEGVIIQGLYGGTFKIYGSPNNNTSVKSLLLNNCTIHTEVENFNVNGNSDDGAYSYVVKAVRCLDVLIKNIMSDNAFLEAYGAFVFENTPCVLLRAVTISNKKCAISTHGGITYMDNVSGVGNETSIRAGSGWGSIGGSTFKGTTSNIAGAEVKEHGGQIW